MGIASDGRRVDLLPPAPMPQWLLGWTFWGLGLSLLLLSTHVDFVSVALTTLAVFCGHISHAISSRVMANSVTLLPRHLRPLMSMTAFDMQGSTCTADALSNLQQHLRLH